MKINTVRFGEIDVEEHRIFDFKLPIIGFGELRKFVIVDTSEDSFFNGSNLQKIRLWHFL